MDLEVETLSAMFDGTAIDTGHFRSDHRHAFSPHNYDRHVTEPVVAI